MSRVFVAIAAILAALDVAGGAFASHALRPQVSDRALEIFETGVRYQMYHALALLLIGILLGRAQSGRVLLIVAGSLLLGGIVLFSGSLYLLSFSNIFWLGIITPIGGVAFLAGWICLAIAAFTTKFQT